MDIAYRLPYKVEDYQRWEGDWELIAGEAVAMAPSPFGPHQGILTQLMIEIGNALKKCQNGCFVYAELDYIVDEFTVFRPDISVTCKKITEFIRTPPKMVVEILSPSTAMKDKSVKFQIYEKEGVEFYLMVDYHLKQVKLYQLIAYQYQKIDDKDKGIMEVEIEGCKVTFDIDGWWKMI